MNPITEHLQQETRRQFLGRSATGIGTAALATLLNESAQGREFPNFAPKAKRIIFLLQSGAPSHVDLFDHKPMLSKMRGKEIPSSVHKNQKLSTMTQGKGKPCLGAIAPMRQRGKSGAWVSDFLPHTASIVDDLCFVKSMKTEAVNHAPAMTFFLTGAEQPGRPSMGAWLSYGLGSENSNLPTFCVMTSRDREGTCGQLFYDFYWGSGFLPTRYQGVKFRGEGQLVLYLSNPPGMPAKVRREMLNGLAKLNVMQHQQVGDPEIQTRIAQYEMAYRMQTSVPELTDLSTESKHTLESYGPDVQRRGSFAFNCLLARRLVEKGVRFVQLMHSGWDQHQNLPTQLEEQCRDTDQPAAALVKDLKQRGLLDDTLVVWTGEFGRTPFGQGDINNKKKHGRDHHPYCYTMWMTGGGIKTGMSYGQTDDFGYNIVKDEVHVHDLQATLLHQMGIDHEKLTFRYQGRYFRLTDVHGNVVDELLV